MYGCNARYKENNNGQSSPRVVAGWSVHGALVVWQFLATHPQHRRLVAFLARGTGVEYGGVSPASCGSRPDDPGGRIALRLCLLARAGLTGRSMFSLWQLGSVALAYVLVLFVIAWWGDRSSRGDRPRVNNAWTYSLALGVYCTSWTFYGAVGEAAQNGWNYLPIYLGPIVTVIFGAPMVYKMVSIARQHHITSIA